MKKIIIALFVVIALFVSLVACSNPMEEKDYSSYPMGVICDGCTDGAEIIDISIPGARYPSNFIMSGIPCVGDQGQTGSCVAWGSTAGVSQLLGVSTSSRISPHWTMVHCGCCNGAQCYSTLNFLDNYTSFYLSGSCGLGSCPTYNINCNCAHSGCSTTYLGGFSKTSISNSATSLKAAMYDYDSPVPFCMSVYETFRDASCSFVYNGSGSLLGGHMMCAFGWDDSKSAHYVQNSWGQDWGCNGYVWISYSNMDYRGTCYRLND